MVDINDFQWDDIRIFLAVMRSGSGRQAARVLGLSRPTVARRLSALEAKIGLQLFERASGGLDATAAAKSILPVAEEAEQAMLAVTRAVHAADHEMRGPIRVAMPAVAAADLLMEDLVTFCQRWPKIDMHISGGYSLSDLGRREADVAIRFMPLGMVPEGNLVGRKVANAHMAIYGEGDCWIGQRGGELDQAWIKDTPFPDLPVRGTIVDGEIIRSACAAGMGMTRLPCFFAEPRLTRRTQPEPGLDVWVLVHADLRSNPRLRAFRDAMVSALLRLKPRLEGRH
ncbi:MAG: LysR family transcriptional regulator [Bradymonadia bacterium]